MHVRVRFINKADLVVVVESKLTKIENFRRILEQKFGVAPNLQLLLYGGKVLEDGYTFHDYNIKLNDVIQVMLKADEPETIPEENKKDTGVIYQDAKSVLFDVGDLIDMKDKEHGAWFEGKIVRIVHDPNSIQTSNKIESERSQIDNNELEATIDAKNNVSDSPPNISNGFAIQDTHSQESEKFVHEKRSKTNIELPKEIERVGTDCILRYLIKSPQNSKISKEKSLQENHSETMEKNLLYQVQLDGEEEPNSYCTLREIRPRARSVIDVQNLKVGQKVMLNYNIHVPREKGYWYDFKIHEIKLQPQSCQLIGTIYLGPEGVPQSDTKVIVRDKVYAIEDLVPLSQRTEAYQMATPPEKRSLPLDCLTCRDNEDAKCKDCGCFLCLGKEHPEKIILCDECNNGYHMTCLSPPLTALPEEDWYCPSCRRDPNDVVAPGAAKQTKKASTSKRDWGRGMACVGKTKTSAMPANHFGPIPGIEVGMCWRFRIQLSESGVHRPPVSGIHGRDVEGAYSIVLSGGYEDDVDKGIEFTYTGSGGRDLSGNKRTAGQSCDQKLTRENKALARNCAVKQITEAGGDAGSDWRSGKPVRVVRSYKMLKHFPEYAPKEGIRYDGIYKVVKYYPETGLSGYKVWKYLLRRDDPCPAPWEPGAKNFQIIYPDGYLEAEAEKNALKEKSRKGAKNSKAPGNRKRALKDTSEAVTETETSPPIKKQKINGHSINEKPLQNRRRALEETSLAVTKTETSPAIKNQKHNAQPEDEEPLNKSESSDDEEEEKEEAKENKDSLGNSKKLATKRRSRAKTSAREGQNASKIQVRLSDIFEPSKTEQPGGSAVTKMELLAIKGDKLNEKLWDECLRKAQENRNLVECVMEDFLCIICQGVAVSPLTTPCLHNFCMDCLKRAFKVSGRACPFCRQSLSTYEPSLNEALMAALRTILPGYDAGKNRDVS